MSWVPINAAEHTILNFLSKMGEGKKLTVLSFKKDRFVSFSLESGNILINESGFKHETITVSKEDLKKKVKDILATEFPRSHKVQITMKQVKN